MPGNSKPVQTVAILQGRFARGHASAVARRDLVTISRQERASRRYIALGWDARGHRSARHESYLLVTYVGILPKVIACLGMLSYIDE